MNFPQCSNLYIHLPLLSSSPPPYLFTPIQAHTCLDAGWGGVVMTHTARKRGSASLSA